jgi:hypothetical protein
VTALLGLAGWCVAAALAVELRRRAGLYAIVGRVLARLVKRAAAGAR